MNFRCPHCIARESSRRSCCIEPCQAPVTCYESPPARASALLRASLNRCTVYPLIASKLLRFVLYLWCSHPPDHGTRAQSAGHPAHPCRILGSPRSIISCHFNHNVDGSQDAPPTAAAMDFASLKDQVSNLTLYDLKAGVRKVQNGVSPPHAAGPGCRTDTLMQR